MKIKHIFSNTIILIALFISYQSMADTIESSKNPVITLENEPSLQIDENESNGIVSFRATLADQCGLIEFGNVNFHYNKATNAARIESLHIRPDHRKKSFGSILLTFALQTLTECKCTIVTWMASPFNLKAGEDQKLMLPKLIAFYKRHGGIVTQEREFNADIIFIPKAAAPAVDQSSIS
jgi:GNAT superfamily N-acetyltransferase